MNEERKGEVSEGQELSSTKYRVQSTEYEGGQVGGGQGEIVDCGQWAVKAKNCRWLGGANDFATLISAFPLLVLFVLELEAIVADRAVFHMQDIPRLSEKLAPPLFRLQRRLYLNDRLSASWMGDKRMKWREVPFAVLYISIVVLVLSPLIALKIPSLCCERLRAVRYLPLVGLCYYGALVIAAALTFDLQWWAIVYGITALR